MIILLFELGSVKHTSRNFLFLFIYIFSSSRLNIFFCLPLGVLVCRVCEVLVRGVGSRVGRGTRRGRGALVTSGMTHSAVDADYYNMRIKIFLACNVFASIS